MRSPAVLHTLSCTGRENWVFAALLGEQVGGNPRQILERQKRSLRHWDCCHPRKLPCSLVVTPACYIFRYHIDMFSPYQYTPHSLPMPCLQLFKCNNVGSLAFAHCALFYQKSSPSSGSALGPRPGLHIVHRPPQYPCHSLPGRVVWFDEHQKRFNRPGR